MTFTLTVSDSPTEMVLNLTSVGSITNTGHVGASPTDTSSIYHSSAQSPTYTKAIYTLEPT